MTVLERIAAEREKQIAKGWTAEHDDEHEHGELSLNAATLSLVGTDWHVHGKYEEEGTDLNIFDCAKKDRGPVCNLIVAAAFLVAEIERIERRDAPKRVPESDGVPPDESIATAVLADVTEHEAYLQGWWAYSFGKHNWDNPYDYRGDNLNDTEKPSDQWELGWLAGQAENGD